MMPMGRVRRRTSARCVLLRMCLRLSLHWLIAAILKLSQVVVVVAVVDNGIVVAAVVALLLL